MLSVKTPVGFLPEEDQGAFFMSIQLPDGASVQRTSEAMRKVETLLLDMPQVQDTFSIIGYSRIDAVSEPNAGFIVAKLKPFAERPTAADSAQALIAKITRESASIRTASVIAFNLPPIIGLSTTGGFEYQLEALEGQDPSAIASVMQALVAAANADPALTRVFSTFTATNPSIFLDIDREKAQALGVDIADIFSALQATLGGTYINDFNLYGRTWQVNLQAEAADRRDFSSIW
jgi:multidrug efflux pump subunit AcrB